MQFLAFFRAKRSFCARRAAQAEESNDRALATKSTILGLFCLRCCKARRRRDEQKRAQESVSDDMQISTSTAEPRSLSSQVCYVMRPGPSREYEVETQLLLNFLGPGDILVMDVKATPGLMAGHTLLCMSNVQWNSTLRMYQIDTAECTRQEEHGGFYRATHLLTHLPLKLVGELVSGELSEYSDENTFLFLLRPPALRERVHEDVFTKVVRDVEELLP